MYFICGDRICLAFYFFIFILLFGIHESLGFKISYLKVSDLICLNDESMFFYGTFLNLLIINVKLSHSSIYVYMCIYIKLSQNFVCVCIIIVIFKYTHAYPRVIS